MPKPNMSAETPLRGIGLPEFNFPDREDGAFRTTYIKRFTRELSILLANPRPETPGQSGNFLLLQNEACRFSSLQEILRIADRLTRAGFTDELNWAAEELDTQVSLWRKYWAFDVVGLPGYSSRKDGQHFLLSSFCFQRLFTRPSYLPREGL